MKVCRHRERLREAEKYFMMKRRSSMEEESAQWRSSRQMTVGPLLVSAERID
jgi:hypothetical protein